MNQLRAFHGDPAVKKKYLNRVAAHRAADELIQGIAWENGKGCAIGCTLDAYDHTRYPIELGLPEWLAHLEDKIFEGLPEQRSLRWPSEFLAAIPVGAIIGDGLRDELAARRLERLLPALEANPEDYAKQCGDALRRCINWLSSNAPEGAARSAAWAARSAAWAESAARSAESAARSAESAESAESAAWAAWAAWAAGAARSAESAADWSAESAAWAARSAAGAAWEREAETLLRLLSECEVTP